MSIHTIDFRVQGKVQGVSFRVFTRDLAQQHGLVGWVKNEPVSVPARAQPYDFMIVLIATLAMTEYRTATLSEQPKDVQRIWKNCKYSRAHQYAECRMRTEEILQ